MIGHRLMLVILMGASGCSTATVSTTGDSGPQAVPPVAADQAPVALIDSELSTVRGNGVELHYREWGAGEPIVFIHGALVDYREWGPVAEQLSDEYRTITYSRRYNHPNHNPLTGSAHSAAIEGEDLAKLIRELGLGPVHLAGISYGGYTALFTALRHPELVRSLTLVEAPLLPWARELPEGVELYDDFMRMWYAAGEAFARDDSVAALRAAVDWFVAPGVMDRIPPDFLAMLMSNLGEWRALTTSTDPFPVLTRADVQSLQVPVLMISGGRSYPVLQLVDAELERHLPDVRRIIVPEGTHDVCSLQVETCADAIRAFLADVRSPVARRPAVSPPPIIDMHLHFQAVPAPSRAMVRNHGW